MRALARSRGVKLFAAASSHDKKDWTDAGKREAIAQEAADKTNVKSSQEVVREAGAKAKELKGQCGMGLKEGFLSDVEERRDEVGVLRTAMAIL